MTLRLKKSASLLFWNRGYDEKLVIISGGLVVVIVIGGRILLSKFDSII